MCIRDRGEVGVGRDADAARRGQLDHVEEARVQHGLAQALQVQLLQRGHLAQQLGEALEGQLGDLVAAVVDRAHAAGELRQRFLADYLETAEDEYVAYWTVRRYVGKGTPPTDLRSAAEIADHVSRTPGAIGYLDEADVPRGMNVLLRR